MSQESEEIIALKNELAATYNLALGHCKSTNFAEAESLLKHCVKENSDNYAINKIRAACASKLGIIYNIYDYKKPDDQHINNAISFFKIANDLDPSNAVYFINLLTTLLKSKNYNETESQLLECIQIEVNTLFTNSTKAGCANNLAMIYSEGKLNHPYHGKATYYFEMARELHPSKSDYTYNLAMHYYNTNNYEAALRECINIIDNYDYVKECSYYLEHYI